MSEWISVKDRLPKAEEEVLVLCKCRPSNRRIITTAIYEDGKMNTDDSDWYWEDIDFNYDEETDQCFIPEGWWEYNHYNVDDYNNAIDDEVTHWMPLPKIPEVE